VKEFLRKLKEVTLMVFQPITAEALPPTAPKASSKTNWTSPQGPMVLRLSELESRHMKLARLSNLRTGLLYAQEYNPGTHFCQRLLKCCRKDYVNGTCDLPACRAMPQPTAPPRPPDKDPR
jgi:hypothetical protein